MFFFTDHGNFFRKILNADSDCIYHIVFPPLIITKLSKHFTTQVPFPAPTALKLK